MRRLSEILIVAGPNGAGKTSFARQFLPTQLRAYTYMNADEIARTFAASGIAQAQIDMRAGREMLNRISQSVLLGENIMLETTLASSNWARHISNWKEAGYSVVLYFIRLPTADAAVARVAHRVAEGGHGIPDPVIRRRFARGLKNLEETYKPLADEWYVFDSFENAPPLLVETWSDA